MPIHRRDFMKLFGVSLASLYLTRCVPPITPMPTCYEPTMAPVVTPPMTGATSRDRLRLYWLRFDELAQRSPEDTENSLGQEWIAGHRLALNELIANGELALPAADLVQEAYEAAVYHVWRSNAPITCYEAVMLDYAPSSAGVLVEQSQVLDQIAAEGTIDPATLAKAQAALEHDLSFYALSEAEVQTLYDQLLKDSQETGQPIPSFEALSLELTPEAREATQFIVDLLTDRS